MLRMSSHTLKSIDTLKKQVLVCVLLNQTIQTQKAETRWRISGVKINQKQQKLSKQDKTLLEEHS